jgi:hypothetical protein
MRRDSYREGSKISKEDIGKTLKEGQEISKSGVPKFVEPTKASRTSPEGEREVKDINAWIQERVEKVLSRITLPRGLQDPGQFIAEQINKKNYTWPSPFNPEAKINLICLNSGVSFTFQFADSKGTFKSGLNLGLDYVNKFVKRAE